MAKQMREVGGSASSRPASSRHDPIRVRSGNAAYYLAHGPRWGYCPHRHLNFETAWRCAQRYRYQLLQNKTRPELPTGVVHIGVYAGALEEIQVECPPFPDGFGDRVVDVWMTWETCRQLGKGSDWTGREARRGTGKRVRRVQHPVWGWGDVVAVRRHPRGAPREALVRFAGYRFEEFGRGFAEVLTRAPGQIAYLAPVAP